MHSAPAVEYPVGRCRLCGPMQVLLLALWLLSLGVWWWAWQWRWPPGAWWCAVLLGLVMAAAWRWHRWHPTVGTLQWEPARRAGGWRWVSAAYRRGTPLEHLRVALDLQTVLLLQGRTAAGLTLWLWLDAAHAPEHWTALRSAVRSHAQR